MSAMFQGRLFVIEQAPEMDEFLLQADLFGRFRFFEKAPQEFKHSGQWSVVSGQ